MCPTISPRLRQLAIFVVFIVGALASVATSAISTSVDIPAQRTTLHLDADNPAAVTRFVVAINAEASSQSGNEAARLRISEVRAADGLAVPLGGADRAHFIVASEQPGAQASMAPAAPGEQPASAPFETEVRPLVETTLPIFCDVGPCERAFLLIAELTDPAAGPLDIDWEVSARIQYSSDTWPSGAGGAIAIDSPTLLSGSPPSLVASTETELITIGPRQPAAARVVEVTIGGAAIAPDTRVAVLSVVATRRSGPGTYDRPPIVTIYPLDGLPETVDGPLPSGLDREPDPFAGCTPGVDCTRQFLVTMEWAGERDGDEAYDWSATVRRADLMRAWSVPAELAASVTRRFDVAPGATSMQTLHLEGESRAGGVSAQDQVQVRIGATTTATDPIARLLPAPAVMTYRARTLVGDPAATPEPLTAFGGITLPGSGMRSISVSIGPRGVELATNPLAGCRVGDSCGQLSIRTIAQRSGPGSSIPDVPFEWSLDVTLYAFEEAPLTLVSTDISPAAN